MFDRLGRFILLVTDYDEAKRFYTQKLGFQTIVDMHAGGDVRYVHLGLPGQDEVGVWLVKAATDEERARVGNQTGSAPCFVLYTPDCQSAYAELQARGVQFSHEPRRVANDMVAHFRDLYGNEVILVELGEAAP